MKTDGTGSGYLMGGAFFVTELERCRQGIPRKIIFRDEDSPACGQNGSVMTTRGEEDAEIRVRHRDYPAMPVQRHRFKRKGETPA